jgi:hypothetical protein
MLKNKVLNLNAESYKHFGKPKYDGRKISPSVFINKMGLVPDLFTTLHKKCQKTQKQSVDRSKRSVDNLEISLDSLELSLEKLRIYLVK